MTVTLESRVIGVVEIIEGGGGGVDIVIIINNREWGLDGVENIL